MASLREKARQLAPDMPVKFQHHGRPHVAIAKRRAAVAVLVALVTVGACFLPAWRASKIDQMVALRRE